VQDLVLEPEQFGAVFEVEGKSGAPLVRRTIRFSIVTALSSSGR
jgi:hypothetical protein